MFKKLFLLSACLMTLFISPVAAEETFDFSAAEDIAILSEGRLKPLLSFSEDTLLQISGRKSYKGKSSLDWLLDVLFTPEVTKDDAIFLINHPDIPEALDMPVEKRRRYRYQDLEPHLEAIYKMATQAIEIPDEERSVVQNEVLRLSENLQKYINLTSMFLFTEPLIEIKDPDVKRSLSLPLDQDNFLITTVLEKKDLLQKTIDQHKGKDPEDWPELDRNILLIYGNLLSHSFQYYGAPFHVLPYDGNWLHPLGFLSFTKLSEAHLEALSLWNQIKEAYIDQDPVRFNESISQYKTIVSSFVPEEFARPFQYLSLEATYLKARYFFWAKLLYFLGILFFLIFLFYDKKIFYLASLFFLLAGLLPHTIGLITRIILLARPPVSNLYETFLFVSWGGILMGLLIEWFNKKGIGLLSALITGFSLLVVAGKYAAEGDTLKVLIAVLNSNFWLLVHVPTITIGYSACCLAGVLGHIYLFQKTFLNSSKEELKQTERNLLGILGFGLVATFFGTCLGGIWADASWGRFWGWDPKENGALMIVLWTVIIFHARLAGMIKGFGIAITSIIGLIVVMWAWFGVNLLSIGLHSYGFTHGIARNLLLFLAFEIVFMLVFGIWATAKQKSS